MYLRNSIISRHKICARDIKGNCAFHGFFSARTQDAFLRGGWWLTYSWRRRRTCSNGGHTLCVKRWYHTSCPRTHLPCYISRPVHTLQKSTVLVHVFTDTCKIVPKNVMSLLRPQAKIYLNIIPDLFVSWQCSKGKILGIWKMIN